MKARHRFARYFTRFCQLVLSIAILVACQAAATPTPTESPTEIPSATPVPVTPTLAESATPTPTPSITLMPTTTLTPSSTPTETTTPYPDVEALPIVSFVSDHFVRVAIDKQISDGVGRIWLAYIKVNDEPATVIPGTPAPASGLETVYLAPPTGGPAIKVVDLPSTTDRRLFWSPNGRYLAYF